MKSRPGFVLVAALVAVVLIALLITGAFFASGQELTIARNEIHDQQALQYAEYALTRALESWDSPAREAMNQGQTVSLAPVQEDMLESSVYITRLDSALYVVVSEARIRTAEAYGVRRRVALLVRTVRDGNRVNPPLRLSDQAWTELH